MIKISELKKSDIGKWVIYHPGHLLDCGKLKSWNDVYIFVVYNCNDEWHRYQDYTGCSTNPNDLTFKGK